MGTWRSVLYIVSFQGYIYVKKAYLGHSKVSLIYRGILISGVSFN